MEKRKRRKKTDLIGPDGVEDEEELDEDAAEGQDSAHDDARRRSRVQRLVGHLARDLIGPHRVLERLHAPTTTNKTGNLT